MHETGEGCPVKLIFSLDEVGISDWEDQEPKKVAVPRAAGAQTIHYRISQNVKRISAVSCMSVGGACLIPYMVTSQDSVALHRSLEATAMQVGAIWS
jgi:hypothetical protein